METKEITNIIGADRATIHEGNNSFAVSDEYNTHAIVSDSDSTAITNQNLSMALALEKNSNAICNNVNGKSKALESNSNAITLKENSIAESFENNSKSISLHNNSKSISYGFDSLSLSYGDNSESISNENGISISKNFSMSGKNGMIAIIYYHKIEKRQKIKIGYVGISGILPNTFYKLDDNYNLIPAFSSAIKSTILPSLAQESQETQ